MRVSASAPLRAGGPFGSPAVLEKGMGGDLLLRTYVHVPAQRWQDHCSQYPDVVNLSSAAEDRRGPEHTTVISAPLAFLKHPSQPAARAPCSLGTPRPGPHDLLTLPKPAFLLPLGKAGHKGVRTPPSTSLGG